jgi:hypothetical protein
MTLALVPELPGDVDDVEAVGDQQRGEAVPQRVQCQPFAGGGDAGAFEGGAEVLADVAVVEAVPERVAPDGRCRGAFYACPLCTTRAPVDQRGLALLPKPEAFRSCQAGEAKANTRVRRLDKTTRSSTPEGVTPPRPPG